MSTSSTSGSYVHAELFRKLHERYSFEGEGKSESVRIRLGDREVLVSLPEDQMSEYVGQLDNQHIPDLPDDSQAHVDAIKAHYMFIWVDEILDSDILETLSEIKSCRNSDGRLSLDAVNDRPPAGRWLNMKDGSWSAWP